MSQEINTDLISRSYDLSSLYTVIKSAAETVLAAESAVIAAARVADRFQENLTADDLLSVRKELSAVRFRLLGIGGPVLENSRAACEQSFPTASNET